MKNGSDNKTKFGPKLFSMGFLDQNIEDGCLEHVQKRVQL